MFSDKNPAFDSPELEKRAAAIGSVVAALGLTVMKCVAGILTGSMGILAEAAHSGLDLSAAFITFLAVRISAKPADETHPYGHGKIENLSALIETGLLFLTCAWIIYESVRRLFLPTVEITPSVWAFLVIVISIVVDINRSRMLYRTARKHRSQALEADALHFSTDVWSSLVVLGGLLCVWLGQKVFPHYAGILVRADAVAALGVAFIILFVSFRLGKRTVDVLLDRAPQGIADKIHAAAEEIDGVLNVGRVRLRPSGARIFVDLTIDVDRNLSFELTHAIAEAVEARISEIVPDADVVIHTDPGETNRENIVRRIRTIADRNQIPVHNVQVHDKKGRLLVDLHIEVDDHLLLRQAQEMARSVERDIEKEIPRIKRVNTHIESRESGGERGSDITTQVPGVVGRVERITNEVVLEGACHDVIVRRRGKAMSISLHCKFDRDMPVVEVHRLSTRIEERLKREIDGVEQVLVHTDSKER